MLLSLKYFVIGVSPEDGLPERVMAAIERQQRDSELLIGWVQVIIAVTLGALYLASPKAFSPEADFAPVPWAVGAYLVFNALRLALGYRDALPRWSPALSVIIDMVLLFGLIWSFHLQYEQPASFYLKAPTFLWVFTFIALRALRFEARFVLLAGATAAAGWLVLVIYATMIDPSDDMITRDYVDYLTSSSVLIGAEVEKLVAILLVTLVLSLALLRARGLLIRSVVEGTAAEELSRFFAPEVAQQITSSETGVRPGQGELREAAVLTIDVRGFTRLAMTLEPNDLMELLGEYESRMIRVVQAHRGSIDKFMGDGLLATFGAAAASETFAADALNAVRDLVEDSHRWAAEREAKGLAPLTINFAVAAGPLVFGAIGDETRLEYTVIGEPVNLAAKLEKHNKVERVAAVTTVDTLDRAIAQGYQPTSGHERRPARRVEGLAEPVDLVVLAS